ncbi:hypothetical protein LP419_08560 [Massilia sp. H-1]|nr:hypothetical protein LP419_08560 [Massilia sp. H-1]
MLKHLQPGHLHQQRGLQPELDQYHAYKSCSTPPPSAWTLVWADEFNGTALDTSKWNIEVNGNGGGNNELQYYTAVRKISV